MSDDDLRAADAGSDAGSDAVAASGADAVAGEDFDTEIETDPEADDAEQTMAVQPDPSGPGTIDWQRIVVFAVLPALAVVLAIGAGFLGWKSYSQRGIEAARVESVAAAREATVVMLSYRADTVERDLMAARDWITGAFLDSYTDLVTNTVIPNAREMDISAQTRVPAAASVSAEAGRAVVLVFVDQVITVGSEDPTGTSSSVRVTLEKIDGRWLVSGFEPV